MERPLGPADPDAGWKLTAVASAFFLLFFKPLAAFRTYTQLDDLCYEAWTARIFGAVAPSCSGSSHAPGAALAWLPAGGLAWLGQGLAGADFMSTLPVWIGLLSFAYWVGALWLLRDELGLREGLLALLCVPVLYYSTHRTTLVHAPELFYCLLALRVIRRGRRTRSLCLGLGILSLRLNDFPLLWAALRAWARGRGRRARRAGLLIGLAALAFLAWLALVHGYHSFVPRAWWHRLSATRLAWLLFGGDWGLVWTAPVWLTIFPWTHPRLLVNSLRLLGDPRAAGLALRHSAPGAVYATWRDPGGPFALPGGVGGLPFQVAGIAAALATIAVLLSIIALLTRRCNRARLRAAG